MGKWEMVRLGDLCEKISTLPTGFTDKIVYIDISSIDNDLKKIVSYQEINGKEAPSRARQILEENDIIVSTVRPNLNAVAINTVNSQYIVVASTGYCVLRCKKTIDIRYIFQFCQSKRFIGALIKVAKGASYPAVSNNDVKNAEIPCPPIDEQKRIAKNLDLASEIVKGYKEQLAELDKLVQSVFYEMFGDPMTNEKGWSVCKIERVISGTASNGFFAKRDDYNLNGNIYVLGVANIVNRMYSNLVGLPQTNASNKDIDKYSVSYGDLLFCRSSLVAEGIGKASIVPQKTPENILFECHVIRLHLNLEICVPEFIQVLTTTAYFRNQLIAQSKTSTMTTISQSGILKSNIVLPPPTLQTRFASIVTEIEAQKAQVQQALTEAENLFNTLMQEYFE